MVDKAKYINYLNKAEEFLDVANAALKQSKNNAAVANAVHSAINAIDSLAVFYFGKRHAGKHEDAIGAIKGALKNSEYDEISKQFGGLMELKNEAEYQPNMIGER